MLEAVGTGCRDYEACWRPVETPDGLPFASVELAVVWAALLLLSIAALLRRLGRD
ncbi:MAG: hypothetical protein ACRDNE_04545 [Gaiellaceae bacterium]